MKKWTKTLRDHYKEVLKLQTSPHSIAFGFALGSFISILPTPGINILLGIGLIAVFPRISKISLFAGLFFWNPLFTLIIYPLSYQLGDLLFGASPVIKYNIEFWDSLYNFSRRFLVGIIVVATVLSAASYFVVRIIAEVYSRKKK